MQGAPGPAPVHAAPGRALSIGLVVPYGEPSDGFFPDTLLAELCARARDAGHRAGVVRVYYDGRDAGRDREVAGRLEAWLDDHDVDVVVLERIFDAAPVRAHVARAPGRLAVLVSRGDSFDPVRGIDLVIGALPGMTRSLATRRTPTLPELSLAFDRLLDAVARGGDPGAVPGVSWLRDGVMSPGAPLEPAALARPYRAIAEQDVIALGPPPRVVRKTIFGNSGCPYASDPLEGPHHRGLVLPEGPLARLGCAFCSMGGDYEKRSDAEIVPHLVEQAAFWTSSCPDVEELLLNDQYAIRYLGALVRAAHAAGVRPVRWLFAARPDSFVRERSRVAQAIAAAEETGHVVELYLSGFEALCDAELIRYHKGATVADIFAAVGAMRDLARQSPRAFAYARARGHSLILWSPWTSPADLGESIDHIRASGARELFHELGKNRIRLYRDLPIYYAAERDGAFVDAWESGDDGAARRKGYNVERPWRFLDVRTRLAHDLAGLLLQRLGVESEAAQLAAIAAFAASLEAATLDVGRAFDEVARGLDALVSALQGLAGERREGAAPRGASDRASVVAFALRCNNACRACPNRETWLDDADEALAARVDAARRVLGPIVLAGREPSMHPSFLALVQRSRGPDGRPVAVVTNGRRFAYPSFTRTAVRAGLSAASVKLFAPDAAAADAIGRDPGAHAQALLGVGALCAAGVPVEIRAPLHAENLAPFAAYAALARAAGARQIRIECALDAVGLDHLADAALAVEALAARCAHEGVALEASPLSAATRLFDRYPGDARRTRRG